MRVLNKRTDRIPTGAVYVGRPSIFGNPFPLTKRTTRAAVIVKHRAWFLERASRDLVFIAALRKLQEATALVCFCAPDPCHADVIAEWVETHR